MATIRDVAARAGVSKASVSRALNQPESVSSATLERVLAAARELSYVPNAMARGLATGKSGIVGLIVPDSTNPVFAHIARGCADQLLAHGLTVALYNSDEQYARECALRLLNEQRQAEGLILASQAALPSGNGEPSPATTLPTVYVERDPDGPRVDAVYIDNRQAARLACEHLLALGHRRIAIVTGLLGTVTGSGRLAGFVESLREAGIALPDRYVLEGNFKLEGGRKAAEELLALVEPPTAAFVSSDLMAYGLVSGLRERGWRVPEDVSVVGCYDLPMSSLFTPSLTTVHVPLHGIGRQAARLLLRRLQRPHRSSTVKVVPVVLTVRQSTRPMV